MDAGLAAIGGALAGALAAVGGTIIQTRTQRATTHDNIRAEYQKEMREVRRTAYASFNSAVKFLAEIAGSDRIWNGPDELRNAWSQEEKLEKAWDEIGFLGPNDVIAEAEEVRRLAYDTLRGLRLVASFHLEPADRRSAYAAEQHVNVLSSQLQLASEILTGSVERFREKASKALGDVGLG